MSRHNNVNPDHYKVAGREHPGEGVPHEQNKREAKMQEKALERQKKKSPSPRGARTSRSNLK
jgi:hypothetical protein